MELAVIILALYGFAMTILWYMKKRALKRETLINRNLNELLTASRRHPHIDVLNDTIPESSTH